jgi:uncharacterized lipoprotein YajG
MHRSKLWPLALALLFVAPAAAHAKRNDPNIQLAYTPTTEVAEASSVPTSEMRAVPAAIELEDDRAVDKAMIGTRTDDDDRRIELRATSDVGAFVEAALIQQAREWSYVIADPDEANVVLAIKLTQFTVDETNQALGATFEARCTLEVELRRSGAKQWSGVFNGDASRYGKKYSAENINEVLSDALAEAFANALNDSGLRSAWGGS